MHDKLLHGVRSMQQPGYGVISHNKVVKKSGSQNSTKQLLSAEKKNSLQKGQDFYFWSDFHFNFLLLNCNTCVFSRDIQVGFLALRSRKSMKGSRVV